MDFIDRDIGSIDRIAIRGVVLLLIAAPLLGYWLARRAIRPLSDIIETTARLRPNRMDERLAIRQTDDELDRLSATVNQFLDRIAVYLSQSNNLLANSAHELRTPLAAIRSSIEVAIGGHRTPQEYQELLSEVIGECASLERLVNQLLLLAETDSELIRAHSEEVDLSSLVERCARNVQRGRRSPPNRTGDSDRAAHRGDGFRQSLAASGQQPAGQCDQIHSSRAAPSACRSFAKGARAFSALPTRAAAFPPADLPHIFERFFRGDRSRQRIEQTTGTGLGLSICQAIVAAHRGRIFVEIARRSSGTTMTVQLPGAFDAQCAARRRGSLRAKCRNGVEPLGQLIRPSEFDLKLPEILFRARQRAIRFANGRRQPRPFDQVARRSLQRLQRGELRLERGLRFGSTNRAASASRTAVTGSLGRQASWPWRPLPLDPPPCEPIPARRRSAAGRTSTPD